MENSPYNLSTINSQRWIDHSLGSHSGYKHSGEILFKMVRDGTTAAVHARGSETSWLGTDGTRRNHKTTNLLTYIQYDRWTVVIR